MYEKILVPLDGSPRAEAILPHVEELAQKFNSTVVLTRVVSPLPILADPQDALESELSALRGREEEARQYLSGRVGELRGKGIEASSFVMYGGVVAEYADVDTIYNHARHPYTQELLKAFPDLSNLTGKLAAIPGYPPRLDALPPGCRFAPRCPAVFERCHTSQPPPYLLSQGSLRHNTPHYASCYLVEAEQG